MEQCEIARDYMIRLAIGNISNASNTEQEKRDDQRTCTVILKSSGFPPKDRRKCKNDDPALDVDTAENIMHGRLPSVPAHLGDTAERLPRARCSLSLSLRDVSTVSAHPTQSDAVAICGGYLELLNHSVMKAGPC